MDKNTYQALKIKKAFKVMLILYNRAWRRSLRSTVHLIPLPPGIKYARIKYLY